MDLELWAADGIALTGAVVSRMTRDEARVCVDEIKAHAETIRERLYAFARGRGWEALGYSSLSASLEAEFGMSRQRAAQLIEAHEIDRILSESTAEEDATLVASVSTPIPETHARELAPILDDPNAVREVYTEVVREARQEGRKPRAKDIKAKVATRKQQAQRPSVTLVPVPGQVLQKPRPPREQPALMDRLYKTIQACPDWDVTTALAEEVQTANLDLPDDAIRKLTDHLKQVNRGLRALVRSLERIATGQRNGTP